MLSHGAALAGRPEWMPSITAGSAMVVSIALATASGEARARAGWLLASVVVAASWRYAPSLLLYLPPAALNVAFGVFFAITLAPGREPRIATFARLERGAGLPPDLVRYTRSLTWMWTVYFFAAAGAGLLLAAFAPLPVWSAFVNVASYIAVAALFAGEYVYRKLRFPQYRHAPLLALVRIVARSRRPAGIGRTPQ